MSKYSEMVAGIKKDSKGTNYSKNDMVSLAMAMFNDANCEITTYVKKGDNFEQKIYRPSQALRTQLIAPILKSFGVDKAEMAKMSDIVINRAAGEALVDFSMLLTKQYVSKNGLGRKLTLPMTSPDETVQSISCETAPEEKRATTMIVRNEDGSYSTTPTGKIVTTASHEKLKVANRVPVWLKKTTDAK